MEGFGAKRAVRLAGGLSGGAAEEGGGRRRGGGRVEVRLGVPVNNAGPGSARRRRSGWWVVVAWWGSVRNLGNEA